MSATAASSRKPASKQIGVPDGLAREAEELLNELLAKCPMSYRPKIEWRHLPSSAGIAYHHRRVIALSRVLVTDTERLNVTLTHEYAHLVSTDRHGREGAGHGAKWKAIMRELGAEPKRTHEYKVEPHVRRQEVCYKCTRCGALILRKRRLPANKRWIHVLCEGRLKLEYVKQVGGVQSEVLQ